jgi:hypothetical protein
VLIWTRYANCTKKVETAQAEQPEKTQVDAAKKLIYLAKAVIRITRKGNIPAFTIEPRRPTSTGETGEMATAASLIRRTSPTQDGMTAARHQPHGADDGLLYLVPVIPNRKPAPGIAAGGQTRRVGGNGQVA